MAPMDDNAEGFRMRALEGLALVHKAITEDNVDPRDLTLPMVSLVVSALLSISAAIEGKGRR